MEQETYDRLSAEVNWEAYGADDADICERAFDASLSFYETMAALYQGTLNLFSAGLSHLIEQQLAALTHDGAIDIAASVTQLKHVKQYYLRAFRDRPGTVWLMGRNRGDEVGCKRDKATVTGIPQKSCEPSI